jgi:hypothetical protein
VLAASEEPDGEGSRPRENREERRPVGVRY